MVRKNKKAISTNFLRKKVMNKELPFPRKGNAKSTQLLFENKKAISPIISTVLLIMIVIIVAIIILMWSRGFIKEAIEKEISGQSKRVEQFCSELSMVAILNNEGSFGFTNNGNVPIYALNLKLSGGIVGAGSSDIINIRPEEGGLVNPGFSTLIKNPDGDYYYYDDYDEVKIIPVLLGKTKTGAIKEKGCEEIYALKI